MQRRQSTLPLAALFVALVVAIVVLSFRGPEKASASPEGVTEASRGESLFPMSFGGVTINGDMFSSDAHRGRVLLINVFWSRCPPCHREAPHLVKLYQARHQDGLDMVMIASDGVSAAQGFAQQYGIPFPVIPNGAPIYHMIKDFKGFPTTVLIDREGNVRTCILGARLEEIREAVDRLLAE